MAVNLSIKNVPDFLVERLRRRAERNHRSLQGELLTILEQSLDHDPLSSGEVIQRLKTIDLKTRSESVEVIREDRKRR